MSGLTDLFKSEKGVAFIVFMLAITVLAATHQMTIDAWRHDALWSLGIYTSGKSLVGAVSAITGNSDQDPPKDPPVSPKPPDTPKPTT